MSKSEIRNFKREIVFTKVPLSGCFKYDDKFQIFPANLDGMPTSRMAHKHHPLILEYWYTEEELESKKVDDLFSGLDDLFKLASLSFKRNELYLNLLNLVTTNFFFKYTSDQSRWGFPIVDENAGEEINKWSSKWCLEWFIWPGLAEQLRIDSFSRLPPLKPRVLPWQHYYTHPAFDHHAQSVKFPDLTLIFFDAYFDADEQTKQILNSAIASSNSAMEFMHTRKKLALLSAFTAIETMVNFETKEFKPSRCEKCGQEAYKISARYRDFLLKYIGNSDSNKTKFNKFYNLRSKFVHTGQEFKTEKLFSDVDDTIKLEEQTQIAEIVILSKLAIVLWTIKNSKNK